MINPNHLRPGNWIYPTGRSKYVVVTGLLLGMMDKNEDFCKEFEGIELTRKLLELAGFHKDKEDDFIFQIDPINYIKIIVDLQGWCYPHYMASTEGDYNIVGLNRIKHLHELQNLIFALTGSELSLPESALNIPQANP